MSFDPILLAHIAIAVVSALSALLAGIAAVMTIINKNKITEIDVKVNGRIEELVELRAQEIAKEKNA